MFEFFRLLSAEDGLRFIVFDCRLPHMAAQQSQGSRPQDAPTNVVSGGRVFWLHAETIQMLRSISWGALEPHRGLPLEPGVAYALVVLVVGVSYGSSVHQQRRERCPVWLSGPSGWLWGYPRDVVVARHSFACAAVRFTDQGARTTGLVATCCCTLA